MVNEIFKEKNIKLTNQREKIYNSLSTPKTLKYLTNEHNEINRSTIYRIINLFLKENIIDEELINNEIYYSIHNNEHIHYIKCIKCNKITKLKICPINKIEGFEIIAHKIELTGICNKCKKK